MRHGGSRKKAAINFMENPKKASIPSKLDISDRFILTSGNLPLFGQTTNRSKHRIQITHIIRELKHEKVFACVSKEIGLIWEEKELIRLQSSSP